MTTEYAALTISSSWRLRVPRPMNSWELSRTQITNGGKQEPTEQMNRWIQMHTCALASTVWSDLFCKAAFSNSVTDALRSCINIQLRGDTLLISLCFKSMTPQSSCLGGLLKRFTVRKCNSCIWRRLYAQEKSKENVLRLTYWSQCFTSPPCSTKKTTTKQSNGFVNSLVSVKSGHGSSSVRLCFELNVKVLTCSKIHCLNLIESIKIIYCAAAIRECGCYWVGVPGLV